MSFIRRFFFSIVIIIIYNIIIIIIIIITDNIFIIIITIIVIIDIIITGINNKYTKPSLDCLRMWSNISTPSSTSSPSPSSSASTCRTWRPGGGSSSSLSPGLTSKYYTFYLSWKPRKDKYP